jgi:hypothetical protein
VKTFIKLLCAAALFACVSSAVADSPEGKLKGIITDSEGGTIGGARILIHWDRSGSSVGLNTNVGLSSDLSIETNQDGEFASSLPPGFYDVFVSAMAFTPNCRKVRINAKESVSYNAKLIFDPIIAKELNFITPMN